MYLNPTLKFCKKTDSEIKNIRRFYLQNSIWVKYIEGAISCVKKRVGGLEFSCIKTVRKVTMLPKIKR